LAKTRKCWQRRFSTIGLLHFQLGAGVRHNEKIDFPETLLPPEYSFEQPTNWETYMTYKVGIGIALGKAEDTQVNEQGIKDLPFSINTTLTYLHYSKQDYGIYNKHLSLQIAPRFYYNLKKQKRIHNLSANYFSIRSQWNIINDFYWDNKKYSFAPIWGMQRRVFEWMFVNYEFGYEFGNNTFEKYIISELKIGIALLVAVYFGGRFLIFYLVNFLIG